MIFGRARHPEKHQQVSSGAANSVIRNWSGEETEDRLHRQIQDLTEQLTQAGQAGYGRESQLLVEQTLQIQEIQRRIVRFPAVATQPTAATQVPSSGPKEPERPIYIASSMDLYDWQAYLLQGEPEWMHAVTGIAYDKIHTLARMVKLEAAIQTIGGVTAKPEAVFEALGQLERFGQPLTAVCHSHRLKGVPQPSDVDWELQERLDRGGYEAIQCIFSEDGYMYWFGNEQRPFEVKVYGKGVIQHAEKIFQTVEKR